MAVVHEKGPEAFASAVTGGSSRSRSGEPAQYVDRAVDIIAVDVRRRLSQIRQEVVAIGRDLRRAKELLKHGQWMPWLNAEFGMSTRTAENYMNVAERLGEKFASLANLRLETAYKLASHATPAHVIEAVLARASSGEVLSDRDAVAMLPKSDRQRGVKPIVSEAMPESSILPAMLGDPEDKSDQRSAPTAVEAAADFGVCPPEQIHRTPPSRNRRQVDTATIKAFEQLKMLKSDRLRNLCPALRACDPAVLAMMLERVLTVRSGASG